MAVKTIYTRWVAYELRRLGFKIISAGPNPRRPQFDCYDFEETPEFLAAFTKITSDHRAHQPQ